MERKLDLSAELYQRIMRELSVIDGFKSSWGSLEEREGLLIRTGERKGARYHYPEDGPAI